MKLRVILSVALIFIVSIANSAVVVITKPQLPTVFRSPANFDMQAEQWLYKANDNIFLFGGDLRGTLYAAYHFLEDAQGVRWWTPWGEESVPASMTAIPWEPTIAGVPAFSYRENYSGFEDSVERPFYAKNRSNGRTTYLGVNYGWNETFGGIGGFVHTFQFYVPASQYFATHPEYFACFNNAYNSSQLCMSNGNVQDIIISQLVASIEADRATALAGGHPMPRYYDLSQNDFPIYCQCQYCAATISTHGNAPSAPLINFVGGIAQAIKTTYPEVTLSTLAYEATEAPPTNLQVEDSVAIRVCGINNNFAKPFSDSSNAAYDGHMQGWNNLANRLSIWHYQTTYNANAAHNFVTANLANDLRYSRDHKVESVFLEHENYKFPDVTWELDNWVSLKLMENPDLSIDTLMDIFCTGYYGTTAGTAIRQYMSQIQAAAASNSDYHTSTSIIPDYRYINCAFVAAAHGYWTTAEANATGVQLQRVKNARLGFDRYVLHSGQRLIDEYAAAHGGSVANFSADVINLYQAAQRSITTLNSLPTDRFPAAAFTTALKNAEIADMNAFSSAYSTITKSAALPSQIANYTHAVFYPGDFTIVAATGACRLAMYSSALAVELDDWDTYNFAGTYNISTAVTTPFPTFTPSTTAYTWIRMTPSAATIDPFAVLYFLGTNHHLLYYGPYAYYDNGITNGSFYAELRRNSSTHKLYVKRVAIVAN